MALAVTQILKPRTLSPSGALDTAPTSASTEVSTAPLTIAPTGVRAPSGPADTSPTAWLPLTGTIPAGGGDTLAISGGGVVLAPTPTTTSTSGSTSAPPSSGGGSSSGQTLLGATGGTPIDTTGGPVGTPAQDTLTNRLLDLIAAQYASGAQGGQSPDFGGLLTAPVGPATGAPDSTGMGSDTGPATTPAKTGHGGLILLLVLLAAGGYWYYRKHHKKRAA